MILKTYELNKINLDKYNTILFYGKNSGYINEAINVLLKNKPYLSKFDEKDILDNSINFLENIYSKSLFEEEKIIVIKRATDKILNIISEIVDKKLSDTKIIIHSDILEKKSKLRTFFEKNTKCICVAFYPDTHEVLYKLAQNFFNEKKIAISSVNINSIIDKSNNDREILSGELKKVELFTKNGKKITSENLAKLINLVENFSISELIDNCLAKNEKKTINILNENNFNNDDCILITRILLNKAKRILKLLDEFEKNKNIEQTISAAKPPIFWKDKEITKKQILKWKSSDLRKLIYELSNVELISKKNSHNSVNVITDFVLKQSKAINSNNFA